MTYLYCTNPNQRLLALITIVLCFTPITGLMAAENPIQIGRSVIAGGGSQSSTSLFNASGTVGQAAIGRSLAGSLRLGSGFWSAPFLGSCCIGTRGDLNADGESNTLLDLNFMVNQIFRGGPDPLCSLESDLDGNGTTSTITDLLYIINFIYRSGPIPVDCP